MALRLTGEGAVPDLPWHRRQAGHRAARSARPASGTGQSSRNQGVVRLLRAVPGVPGPRPGGRRPLPGLRQRPGDELADHPGAHPGRGGRRPADQARGQGRSRRARRPGRRPVRPVHVKPHPVFGRSGDNLTVTVPVTFAEAGPGRRGQGAAHGGAPVTVRMPPGTPNGRTLRVRGKGVRRKDGTPGDLLVTVEVTVPQKLNGKARSAIEDLREATAGRRPA